MILMLGTGLIKGAVPSEVVEKSATLRTASFTPQARPPSLRAARQGERFRRKGEAIGRSLAAESLQQSQGPSFQ